MATVTYSWAAEVLGFILNGQTLGNQSDVAITATADGGYLGAWSVGSAFVRGRYVDADGTPGAEHDLNTTLTGNQFDASMALLGNGHNVVTFTDSSSGTDTVRVRILGDGAPFLDFAVPANEKPLRESDVTALGSGGFAVAYTRDYGSGDTDLLVQRYEADGDEIGGPISVDGQFGVATDHASVAGLASGGFVVAWEQSAAAGGDHSVWFQLYNASGIPVTAAGDAPGSHHLIDNTGSFNRDVQVAALPDGGFVVAYVDNGWIGADNTEITARVYNADGTARSGYIWVNTDIAGAQLRPTVTVLSNGFFVVGWQDNGVFYYQAYDPSGAAAGANYSASNAVLEGEILGLAGGVVASVSQSSKTDGDGGSVHSSIDELIRTTTGTAGDDTLTGDSLRDVMMGGVGDDTLDGDIGNDTLSGGIDDDILRGGAGADALDGGVGTDTASYVTGAVGVTVNLTAGTGSGGDAQGDTLAGIENLSGSQGHDTLIGTSGANALQGWNGNDLLRGGAGADVLDGGAGIDIATYHTGLTGVVVSLVTGIGAGGDAAGDTLTSIENLLGSQGNDSLVGNTGDNVLQGLNGNDVLTGAGGKDTLIGGAGADRFVYGSAAQSPVGAGADRITDFSQAQGDRIDLAAVDASTLAGGNQAFTFIGTATFTGVAGQLRFAVGGGLTTIAGDVNGDGTADFHIQLTGSIALVAG
ncbi:M10 family metallopeptidase C-terminal domain-containing protein, partial [Inquilinus limosus]